MEWPWDARVSALKLFATLDGWRRFRAGCAGDLGFVPTLGGLHEGHASLISRARAENEVAVVSIFLNPAQFNDQQDLANYPAAIEEDLAKAERLGADAVLTPSKESVYPDGYRFKVQEDDFSRELCGAGRPGHFTGVLTVVMKLLNLVKPHRAYFGEKDYQQLSLIRDMVGAFFMDVAIVPCPTVRAEDGLALSSRNALLDAEGRRLAAKLHEALRSPRPDDAVAQALAHSGLAVEYVATRQGRRFAAVTVNCGGKAVRLIDNLPVEAIECAAPAATPAAQGGAGP